MKIRHSRGAWTPERLMLTAEGDGDDGGSGAGDPAAAAPADAPAADPAPTAAAEVAPASNPVDVGAIMGSADWVQHVSPDFLNTATKYNSLADFTKAHSELQSKMGDAVFMPGKDATPEDIGKFYNRIGRPEAANGYEAPEIEGFNISEERWNGFSSKAHELGLTQQQLAGLVEWDAGNNSTASSAATQAHEDSHSRLAEAWGENAGANYEMARRTGLEIFTAEERKALGMSDVSKDWNPVLVSALARVSERLQDDHHVGRSDRDIGKSDEDLKTEAAAIQEKQYLRTSTPAEDARVAEIFGIMYGDAPIGPGGAN